MKSWTADERAFLRTHYSNPNISLSVLAEELGRSLESLKSEAYRLGLRRPGSSSQDYWSADEMHALTTLYPDSTIPMEQLEDTLGRSRQAIKAKAARLGLQRLQPATDFLSTWSADMAYVLGYWWADGSLSTSRTQYRVFFSSNDRDHLETIAQIVGVPHHIVRQGMLARCYNLVFANKRMYEDIEALGGTPHKSSTIGFPSVPDWFLADFLRGVVDGDGSLYLCRGRHPGLSIVSGSQSFLIELVERIEATTGVPIPRLRKDKRKRSVWAVRWEGIRAKCLVGWLYEGAWLALPRKAACAAEQVAWRPQRTTSRIVTPKMREVFAVYLDE